MCLFAEKNIVCEVLYNFGYNHEAPPHATAIISRYLHVNNFGRDNCRWYETFADRQPKILVWYLKVYTEEKWKRPGQQTWPQAKHLACGIEWARLGTLNKELTLISLCGHRSHETFWWLLFNESHNSTRARLTVEWWEQTKIWPVRTLLWRFGHSADFVQHLGLLPCSDPGRNHALVATKSWLGRGGE